MATHPTRYNNIQTHSHIEAACIFPRCVGKSGASTIVYRHSNDMETATTTIRSHSHTIYTVKYTKSRYNIMHTSVEQRGIIQTYAYDIRFSFPILNGYLL